MKLHLHVKFRAFGRDIYNLDKSWPVESLFPGLVGNPLLETIVAHFHPQVLCNERGVLLELI